MLQGALLPGIRPLGLCAFGAPVFAPPAPPSHATGVQASRSKTSPRPGMVHWFALAAAFRAFGRAPGPVRPPRTVPACRAGKKHPRPARFHWGGLPSGSRGGFARSACKNLCRPAAGPSPACGRAVAGHRHSLRQPAAGPSPGTGFFFVRYQCGLHDFTVRPPFNLKHSAVCAPGMPGY